MDEPLIYDDPKNGCFGCSPTNPNGLGLHFRKVGDGQAICEYQADESFAGAPVVVHGGIQATLLDETMGMAIHAMPGCESQDHVTVELHLRYRRPAATGSPLRVRAHVVRREAHDFWLEGEIEDAEGRTLTRAEGRWRQLRSEAS